VYGRVRIAQRRLARLREYGLVRGFWAAGANRARGRHVFELTGPARAELELLTWNGQPPVSRRGDPPTSGPIHQLATHDVFAAFLRASRPDASEGLVAWIPERACRNVFDGFVRPDAIAGLGIGRRLIVLCIERDLGTERSEILAAKIRRYRRLSQRGSGRPISVAFIVDSARRARTIHDLAADERGGRLPIVSAQLEDLATELFGRPWSSGRSMVRTDELPAVDVDPALAPLAPTCLLEANTLATLDDRAAGMLLLSPRSQRDRMHGSLVSG
jgi:hypothetical protein